MEEINADDLMEIRTKKIGIRMNLMMSILNSAVFSVIGTLMSGHFAWSIVLCSFIVGSVIQFTIGLSISPKKVSGAVLKKAKIPRDSVKGKLLSAVVTSLIFTPVISLIMGVLMPTMASMGLEVSAASLEVEVVAREQERDALIVQQNELKNEQAALIEQTESDEDNMELQADIDSMQASIDAMQNAIDSLNGVIGGMSGGAAAQRQSISAIRRSIPINVLKAELVMNSIGILLVLLFHPIFLRIAMRPFVAKK